MTMPKGLAIWRCETNPHYRGFSHRVPIEGYYSWERHHGTSPILNQADGHPTFEALKNIPGIEHIHNVGAYQINITKGRAFDWDEIEPAIFDVLLIHNNTGGQ